ncbi:adenylyltransferase/cytidyltransferase family protein [bacterium]|nr:adenylyltransferase/cytidyltransferase family protein [bacterium]
MLSTASKIVSREELAKCCEELRKEGKTIVTCNGSFDLFHYGHLCFLEEAKAQADVLIVGLNSDSSIKQYKSPLRPIIGQEQRAALLSALSIVSYVHIFDETVPMPFLEVVKPNVHVNGSEYGENCIEAPTVKKYGGRIHLMPKVAGLSTTGLIERIRTLPL